MVGSSVFTLFGSKCEELKVRQTDAMGSYWRIGDLEWAILCYQLTWLKEPRNDPAVPLSLTGRSSAGV